MKIIAPLNTKRYHILFQGWWSWITLWHNVSSDETSKLIGVLFNYERLYETTTSVISSTINSRNGIHKNLIFLDFCFVGMRRPWQQCDITITSYKWNNFWTSKWTNANNIIKPTTQHIWGINYKKTVTVIYSLASTWINYFLIYSVLCSILACLWYICCRFQNGTIVFC